MWFRRLKPNKAHLRVATLAILIVMCTLVILSAVFPFPEGSNWTLLAIGFGTRLSAYAAGEEIVAMRDAYSKLYYEGGNSYSGDYSMGTVHYQDDYGDWQEIDNAWVGAQAPWDWEMTQDAYHTRVLEDFTSGQVLMFESHNQSVAFQPMALEWTNDLDQISQISMPQNVIAGITNTAVSLLPSMSGSTGNITWVGAYGDGTSFSWINSPGVLQKILTLESQPEQPPQYIIDGGNPVLRLSLIFVPSEGVDIYTDGGLWNEAEEEQTFSNIEFKAGNDTVWFFAPAKYWSRPLGEEEHYYLWESLGITSGAGWTDPGNAVDDSLTTYTEYNIPKSNWSEYLTTSLNGTIDTDNIRVYTTRQTTQVSGMQVDAYYGGGWHTIYDSDPVVDQWVEYPIGSSQNVSDVRVRYYASQARWVRCHEIQVRAESEYDNSSTIAMTTLRAVNEPVQLYVDVLVPYEWLDLALYPVYIDPTVEVDVGASSDDAIEREGVSTLLTFTYVSATAASTAINRYWGGMRWESGSFPDAGATITDAYVEGYVYDTTYDDCDFWWHCQDGTASPTTFTTGGTDISSRTRTTASTYETSDSIGTGLKQFPLSGDLIDEVQEVIDNYSPTAIVVIMRPNTSGTDGLRFYSWDYNDHSYAPVLHLEWDGEAEPSISNTPSSKDFGVLELGTNSSTAINYFTITNNGTGAVDVTIQGTNATCPSTWVGETGEDFVLSSTYYGGFLYCGLATNPAKVIKINRETMTTNSSWTSPSGQSCSSLTSFGGYIYAGLHTIPAVVVKIDPSDMSTVSNWTGTSGQDYCLSLVTDGISMYAGLSIDPPQVIKINPSTMTTADTWVGNSGYTHCLAYDGIYIYAGLSIGPAKVVQIDTSTMTTVDTWTGAVSQNYSYSLAAYGGSIYVGLDTEPGQVVKIDPASMTTTANWTGESGQDYAVSLLTQDGYIYAGLYTSPVQVVKISTSTMATSLNWTGGVDQDYSPTLTSRADIIYTGIGTNPGQLVAINGVTMTSTAIWVLSGTAMPGENIYGLLAGLDDDDDTFDTVVNSTANSFVTGLAEVGTQDWGLRLLMPASLTGYLTQQMSATITLVASAAS